MSREAAELAREAARVIEVRGMCKNDFMSREGKVCLHGAIAVAQGMGILAENGPAQTDAYHEIRDMLKSMKVDPEGSTKIAGAGFNDLPDTTERDVAKVLLQVADQLELQ